jgi:hypothetical protein
MIRLESQSVVLFLLLCFRFAGVFFAGVLLCSTNSSRVFKSVALSGWNVDTPSGPLGSCESLSWYIYLLKPVNESESERRRPLGSSISSRLANSCTAFQAAFVLRSRSLHHPVARAPHVAPLGTGSMCSTKKSEKYATQKQMLHLTYFDASQIVREYPSLCQDKKTPMTVSLLWRSEAYVESWRLVALQHSWAEHS